MRQGYATMEKDYNTHKSNAGQTRFNARSLIYKQAFHIHKFANLCTNTIIINLAHTASLYFQNFSGNINIYAL